MTVTFAAERYSRSRTTVMGIATAMVLWFHSVVIVPEGGLLDFFKLSCDVGVDLFLFASGTGIYFSVKKCSSYREFMASRLRRVLPTFLLATIPWFVYKEFVWGQQDLFSVFWNASTLSYWLEGNLTCWYVSSLLVLYLLTPLYMKLWEKYRWFPAAAITAVYLFGGGLMQWTGFLKHLSLFIYRIPVYLFGLSMGKAIQEKRSFRVNIPLLVAVACLCVYLTASCIGRTNLTVLPWLYKYFIYGPFAVILSILFSWIPSNPVTGYLGKRSLETYMLFEKTLEILCDFPSMWVLYGNTKIAFCVVALVLTLIGSELLAWAAAFLVNLTGWVLDKRKQPL